MKNKRIQQTEKKNHRSGSRQVVKATNGHQDLGELKHAGAICLSPAVYQFVKKMQHWMSQMARPKSDIASCEIKDKGLGQQQITLNNYAPPIANRLDDKLIAPTGLSAEATSKPNTIRVSWDFQSGKNLYLLQVNNENPDLAEAWTTNSISMFHQVEMDNMNLKQACWIRICSLSNSGRSLWNTLAIHESLNRNRFQDFGLKKQ